MVAPLAGRVAPVAGATRSAGRGIADDAGGRGIPVRVDHLVPEEVAALVSRVDGEQGTLHVLVNDIFGATTGWAAWPSPWPTSSVPGARRRSR